MIADELFGKSCHFGCRKGIGRAVQPGAAEPDTSGNNECCLQMKLFLLDGIRMILLCIEPFLETAVLDVFL